VHVLQHLSKELRNISICITDNDGQFLLIEAAEFIPTWLSPENAANRVWIRNGQVIIVPLDEPGGQRDGSISLSSALKFMRSNKSLNRNDDVRLNSVIANRTTDVYPAKIYAYEHHYTCILPRFISEIFTKCPQLVACAAIAFCTENSTHKLEKLTKSKISKSSISLPFLEEALKNCKAWTAVSIRFTRALYAKLTFQKFYPPRKYHSVMRTITQSGSNKVITAFDVGCRLCVGLDLLYVRETANEQHIATKLQSNLSHFTSVLRSPTLMNRTVNEVDINELETLYKSQGIVLYNTTSPTAFRQQFTKTYGFDLDTVAIEKISPHLHSLESTTPTDSNLDVNDEEENRIAYCKQHIFHPITR